MPEKKLTIAVSDAERETLKAEAALMEMSLTELVFRAVDEYLDRRGRPLIFGEPKPPHYLDINLPVVRGHASRKRGQQFPHKRFLHEIAQEILTLLDAKQPVPQLPHQMVAAQEGWLLDDTPAPAYPIVFDKAFDSRVYQARRKIGLLNRLQLTEVARFWGVKVKDDKNRYREPENVRADVQTAIAAGTVWKQNQWLQLMETILKKRESGQ